MNSDKENSSIADEKIRSTPIEERKKSPEIVQCRVDKWTEPIFNSAYPLRTLSSTKILVELFEKQKGEKVSFRGSREEWEELIQKHRQEEAILKLKLAKDEGDERDEGNHSR